MNFKTLNIINNIKTSFCHKCLCLLGNTILQVDMTSRNYLLTLNEKTLDHYDEIIEYLNGLKNINYLLVTEHIGQANKHYHMYIQSDPAIRLSRKKLFGGHIDRCFGGSTANINYCKALDKKHKKEGITAKIILEKGEVRKCSGSYSVKDLKEMKNPDELNPIIYNAWKKIRNDLNRPYSIDEWRKNVKVYWIQGPSGIGKTNKAFEIADKFIREKGELESTYFGMDMIYYDKNGFYHGVSRNCCAIYDDFRDNQIKPAEFVHLIDYNRHWLNVKGSAVINDYELIIFTSVQNIEDIYRNVTDEPRKQWLRRIEIIDMNTPKRYYKDGEFIGYEHSNGIIETK